MSTGHHSLIGRAADLATTWDTLSQRSLLLTGPRRVGKTALLRALVSDPRSGWCAVRIDLEGESTVEGAVARIRGALSSAGRLGLVEEVKAIAPKVDGVTFAGGGATLAPAAPKDAWGILRDILLNAVDALPARERLVISLDEAPWWLDGIVRAGGAEAGRTALARLRSFREDEDLREQLRFVLTGSVGLAGLAHDIGASAELNDITPAQELRPLDVAAARALFEMELLDRTIQASREATEMASNVSGGLPHWLKALAQRVRTGGGSGRIEVSDVEQAVQELLQPRMRNLFADEGGEHLARREAPESLPALRAMLDAASTGETTPEEALLSAAMSTVEGRDRRWARNLLYRLSDAYYLDRDGNGDWHFVVPLLRLWWQRYGAQS